MIWMLRPSEYTPEHGQFTMQNFIDGINWVFEEIHYVITIFLRLFKYIYFIGIGKYLILLARPSGLEPETYWLEEGVNLIIGSNCQTVTVSFYLLFLFFVFIHSPPPAANIWQLLHHNFTIKEASKLASFCPVTPPRFHQT